MGKDGKERNKLGMVGVARHGRHGHAMILLTKEQWGRGREISRGFKGEMRVTKDDQM